MDRKPACLLRASEIAARGKWYSQRLVRGQECLVADQAGAATASRQGSYTLVKGQHAIGLRLRQGRGKRPGVAADHAARAGAARLMLVVGHFHALELFALQLDGDDVGPRDQADGRRHREKSRLSHRGRLLDVLDVQPQSDTRFVSDVLAVHTPATFRLVGFAHESAASLVGKPHRVLPVLLHREPHSGSASPRRGRDSAVRAVRVEHCTRNRLPSGASAFYKPPQVDEDFVGVVPLRLLLDGLPELLLLHLQVLGDPAVFLNAAGREGPVEVLDDGGTHEIWGHLWLRGNIREGGGAYTCAPRSDAGPRW